MFNSPASRRIIIGERPGESDKSPAHSPRKECGVGYFADKELECKCSRCRGKNTYEKVSQLLRERLEELRGMWGAPIIVECAYRCPEHNAEEGGVTNSTHTQGLAADIWVGKAGDFSDEAIAEYERFYKLIKDSHLFDGVGYYPRKLFCHVDVRDGGRNPNKHQFNG